MKEIIEFLGKEIRKGKIEDNLTFECQAMEAVVKILSPWLHRVTMKNIGSILFAGEHDFGRPGLDVGVHCRKRSFPKGITSKTQAFIGEHSRSRGLVKDVDVPQNVYRYQQFHWAFTRKGRWLRIEILYEIKHAYGGKSIENASLSVEETSLEALVRDDWGFWILRGLSDEIQQAIEHRVRDLQKLISLQVHLGFINNLVAEVVES